MLIKPFPQGKGAGSGPVDYLLRLDYHGRKACPPTVLRGDPDMTKALIDSIDREWKFTAGVCSWGPEDSITPEQEIEVMEKFESVAFAGLQPDQYSILWVRHSHAGHHELHFVTPRMELSAGKAFNAFPPGWEKDFAPLRDLENIRNGWTRPGDPERARLFAPSTADIIEARLTRWGQNPTKQDKEQARDAINAYIKSGVENGSVRDRAHIVMALREAGLDINREGRDYITVKDPASGEKIRLKGGVYGAGWTLEKFGRAHEGEGRTGTDRDGEGFQRTIADLEEQLADIIAKRSVYNVGRYGTGDCVRGGEIGPALPGFEHSLRESLDADRDHGDGDIVRSDSGRLGADEGRGLLAGNVPFGTGPGENGIAGPAADLGEIEKRGVGIDAARRRERAVHHNTGRDQNQSDMDQGQKSGNQIGVIDREQERIGTDSVGHSGTAGPGSAGGPPEPGREDTEHGEPGGRLRAAIDAVERIVTEFKAAYRRVEQYFAEQQEKLENDIERNRRGRGR
ncbi:MAG: relaxase/mobilization nuclease domain-containing protein [Planctomycetes bacterium]|nr:relaxase/mobilization nuclease domain-containing protein [Planctomycetota bacterium]